MDTGIILPLALLLVVVALVRYTWRGADKESETIVVSSTPERATSQTVSYLAEEGYLIDREARRSAVASRRKKPSIEMVAALGLAIFPGIAIIPLGLVALAILALPAYLLYFAAVRPRSSVSVVASGDRAEARLTVSGDDHKARANVARWVRQALA